MTVTDDPSARVLQHSGPADIAQHMPHAVSFVVECMGGRQRIEDIGHFLKSLKGEASISSRGFTTDIVPFLQAFRHIDGHDCCEYFRFIQGSDGTVEFPQGSRHSFTKKPKFLGFLMRRGLKLAYIDDDHEFMDWAGKEGVFCVTSLAKESTGITPTEMALISSWSLGQDTPPPAKI